MGYQSKGCVAPVIRQCASVRPNLVLFVAALHTLLTLKVDGLGSAGFLVLDNSVPSWERWQPDRTESRNFPSVQVDRKARPSL